MRTLTKADLVAAIYEAIEKKQKGSLDRSRDDVRQAVETLIRLIKKSIAEGGLLVSGFGRFDTLRKRERMGRNPQTGKSFPITARRVPVFRMSKCLREAFRTSPTDKVS